MIVKRKFHVFIQKHRQIVPYGIISLIPLVLFLISGLIQLDVNMFSSLFSSRVLVLLFKTFFYSLSVSIFCVIFGSIISIIMLRVRRKVRQLTLLVMLMVLTIPSTVYALMWMDIITRVGGDYIQQTGWGIAVFVQSMYMLPISVLIIYYGMRRLPVEPIETARFLAKSKDVFFRIWLPACRPIFVVTGLIVFIMTINDYSIPSSFSVTTYSMEIFAKYSISLSASEALIAGLPLLVLCLLSLVPVSSILSQYYLFEPSKQISPGIESNLHYQKLIELILLLVLFIMILPVVILISQADFIALLDIDQAGIPEIIFTLLVCIVAGLLALPVMWMAANWTKRYSEKLWLILIPLAISPSLIGAALIQTMNQGFSRFIYVSPFMLVLGIIIRFMPLGILVLLLAINYLPEEYFVIGYMKGASKLSVYTKIIFPMMLPFYMVSLLIIILFGIGELGTSVMITPPGYSTITVKIYGYLHYGASEKIGTMSIWVILIIIVTLLLLWYGKRQIETGQKKMKGD